MKDNASDLNQRIAERVSELRSGQALSLDALARKTGVSRSMISVIERGESSPTAVVLEKLAAGLGVPLASLFDGPASDAKTIMRSGCAAQRPTAMARPGVGLPTSQRLTARCAAADANRRGPFPTGQERGIRGRRARRHAYISKSGYLKAPSTSRSAKPATGCAKAIVWPCNLTVRRCFTTPHANPRATPW